MSGLRGRAGAGGRRGMIFPMIILMVFIFVVFVIMLQNFNTQNRRINYKDVMRRQALYVAEAGMQHALMKLQTLQTDAFDALMISQLKNPRFNFNKPINNDVRSRDYNPGPKYIAKSAGERDSMLKDSAHVGDPDAAEISGDLNQFVMDFIADIQIDEERDVAITDKDKVKFKYGYKAKSVKILGETWEKAGGRDVGLITAEFIIEGYAYDKSGTLITDTVKRVYKLEKRY